MYQPVLLPGDDRLPTDSRREVSNRREPYLLAIRSGVTGSENESVKNVHDTTIR